MFDLGVLGQTLLPALAGHQAGVNAAEAEAYKRRQAEEEARAAASRQALQEYLLRQREAREAELHPLQVQTERLRALGNLDFGVSPAERLGDGLSSKDELEMKEIQSRIAENDAQRDLYKARTGQVGKGGAGGRSVVPEWQKRLDLMAESTRGDLFQMHQQINNDPELYQLRANRTIRDYHIGAAAAKARKANLSVEKHEIKQDAPAPEQPKYGETETGAVMPYRYRKFPSESAEVWVGRMKKEGLDPDTIAEYAEFQNLDLDREVR
jgi:hypothetical protein